MTHSPKMEVASGVSSKSSSSNFKADDRLYEQHVRKNNEKLLNPIPWTLVFETSLQRPCFSEMRNDITKPWSHIAGDGHDSHSEGLESSSGKYLEFSVFIQCRLISS